MLEEGFRMLGSFVYCINQPAVIRMVSRVLRE